MTTTVDLAVTPVIWVVSKYVDKDKGSLTSVGLQLRFSETH